ncbi:MAG: acetoacetate--CoA ligase [Candidatus Eremiobacteraeota bacterium]|nr:acetoacetate--CoA ligase [Candidatus Eremiobacteraeota bacterium]
MIEGTLLWTPDPARAAETRVAHFMRRLAERGHDFTTYEELRRWSVSDLPGFWGAVWDFFDVHSRVPYDAVHDGRPMPQTTWFPGSRVNYAEHMLRHEAVAAPDEAAIVHSSELRPLAELPWRELGGRVRVLATALRELGVVPGDRVAAYMPTIPETAIAMLATTAIGAVWSSAAPEFGVRTIIDRFAQIEPKVLFVADGYRFGGKDFDRQREIEAILGELPSVEHVVWLPYLHAGATTVPLARAISWNALLERPPVARDAFAYEYLGPRDPLWILFSSGTTGLPKAIVHGHVGVLVEHLKSTGLAQNLGPDSRTFFYTTTGWMMFNALLSGLLQGSSVVLYDGHPAHPSPSLLWQLAADAKATTFGASPTYVQIMRKFGIVPRDGFDLSRLNAVLLTGSPVTPEATAWFYDNVKSDLWVTSPSGGTELCAGLVGGSPLLPVRAGEIQTRLLGMDVHAWNDAGEDVEDEVGELVVTSPSPSMPLAFWNDAGGARYRETYFEQFPGVWRHGDFLKINRRGGCYIYGRSDSTLNRFGVRIGSSEIYRAVEELDAVLDSLVVCLELPDGGFYMPLFVKVAGDGPLDDALRESIVMKLRTDCSPRHVPDEIHRVPDVPYTLTGKKMEIPVRRIIAGMPPAKVASREAMMNPDALDWYVDFAQSRDASRLPEPA